MRMTQLKTRLSGLVLDGVLMKSVECVEEYARPRRECVGSINAVESIESI